MKSKQRKEEEEEEEEEEIRDVTTRTNTHVFSCVHT